MSDKFVEAIEHFEMLSKSAIFTTWRNFNRNHVYTIEAKPHVFPGAYINRDGSAWVYDSEGDCYDNPPADCFVLEVWNKKALIWTGDPDQFTCPITKYEVKR